MARLKTRRFNQIVEDIRNREYGWHEIELRETGKD
jgi:hypothetical protein